MLSTADDRSLCITITHAAGESWWRLRCTGLDASLCYERLAESDFAFQNLGSGLTHGAYWAERTESSLMPLPSATRILAACLLLQTPS